MRNSLNKPSLLVSLYLNPDYYPPTFNAVNILREYFHVHVICRNHQPPFRQWPPEVEVRRLGEYSAIEQKMALSPLAKLLEYRAFMKATRDTIDELEPRVIYAYEPYAFAAVCLAGGRRLKIPTVYHLHELPEDGPPITSLQAWVSRYALGKTRAASVVVFPERNRAAYYLRAARDPREAVVVPNCPARSFFPVMAEAELSALVNRRWATREIVYIGSIGDEHCNLEAARALRHFGPDTRMAIIGWAHDAFAAELMRVAAEAGAGDRFSMPGPISHSEFAGRALRASIGLAMHKPVTKNLEYVASATNKLFEYAACGLPVIVPDLPNYHDFLDGEEWVTYADPYDPTSIAKAVDAILADRAAYVHRSIAAHRYFHKRYHYERVFEPLLNRILELAGIAQQMESPAWASMR